MHVSKNFLLQEFVPKEFWNLHKEKSLWAIDERIIIMAQQIRDDFNSTITINNWCYGGTRNESGLRVPESKNYNPRSQHTYGRAVDIVSVHYSAEEMRQHIFKNPEKYEHITAIELDVNWLHIDCRYTNQKQIFKFKP